MKVYIALLRGINVSGQKLIKMAELKLMFEGLGFERVQTYIQSGNVLFESQEIRMELLRSQIEEQIESVFGFQVTVVLRTVQELERVVRDCPFRTEDWADGETLYVSLLAEVPAQPGIDWLLACNSEVDDYHFADTEVYVFCRQSIRKSMFSNNLLEKKLGVAATTRNWATTRKLLEMGKAMEV